MKARLTLKPGQRGTKKLLERYGDDLLYVRYRYDAERKKRIKTVELIIEETDWEPSVKGLSLDQPVDPRVAPEEKALQRAIKQAGGIWSRHCKVWKLRYVDVIKLGIEERMVNAPTA